jgi:hypothetical protein
MPANDDGCRFGHHRRCHRCRRVTNYIQISEVNINKLIGVVHANVGQKRLNCNIYVILSIF